MALRKRIAELYIWLLPVSSVPVMFLVKNNFDREVFLFAVVVHLLLVALSLGIITRDRQPSDRDHATNIRPAVLLIIGAVLTFIAATTFVGTAPEVISKHKFEHYWTSIGFFLATLASLAGALFLLISLKDKPGLSFLSFTLLLVGTVLWIIHLAFRLTVLVWVSDNALNDNTVLNTYTMINSLSISLYAIYMGLGYLSFAGFASALVKAGLLQGWLIKICTLFSIVAPVLFAFGVFAFGMPITAQMVPFLIGVMLLTNKHSSNNQSSLHK